MFPNMKNPFPWSKSTKTKPVCIVRAKQRGFYNKREKLELVIPRAILTQMGGI